MDNNADMIDFLQNEREDSKFRTSLIYHSMPSSCALNPDYRHDFMMKFGGHVQHIMDCPDTNKEQYSRMRALNLVDVVKKICPKIVNIPDRNYIDHKLERREEMEATLLKDKSNLKIQHSELGLLYQLYGSVD